MTNSRWYKKGDALLSEIENTKADNGAVLWFLGQMGFVIKINKTIIYIDALLNDFDDGNGNGRIYEPPFYTTNGITADYFICTHDHGDHLNLETLLPQSKANGKTQFIVPAPACEILTKAGIEKDRIIGAKEGAVTALTFNEESIIELCPVANVLFR